VARLPSSPQLSVQHSENRDAVRPEPSGRFYLPELDILRFFAFLWMFAIHASISFPASDTTARPRVVLAGFYTVDLFFALSAYLLTQLGIRELGRRGAVDVRTFYLRRILRLWPLYFFFLGVVFVLSITFRDSPYSEYFTVRSAYFTAYLFFVGNFANCRWGPPVLVLSPLWTVSVEEQVYLIFPWVVRTANPRTLALIGGALVVLANVVRVEYAYHFTSGVPVWFDTFAHLDSIGIGILLAALPPARLATLAPLHRIVLGATGIACWLVAINYYDPLVAADTPFQEIMSYPLGALGCGAILAAVIGASAGRVRSALGRCLAYLGKISYGLYVYHGLGITLTIILCGPLTERATTNIYSAQLVNSAIAYVVTFCMAACSYKWLEAPFLRLKGAFTVVASRAV
jgi:peptidoglycan/LPS O-acetylase OafA/YrhL